MPFPTSFVKKPFSDIAADALVHAGVLVTASPLWDKSRWVTWKSGLIAPVFMESRMLLASPEDQDEIAAGLAHIVTEDFGSKMDAVVGVADGHWWTALVAARASTKWCYIRKEGKNYGPDVSGSRNRLASVGLPAKSRLVIVEDAVVSGKTVATTCDFLQGLGHEVIGLVSITNLGKKEMFDRMAARMVTVRTLVTHREVLAASVRAGKLSPEASDELRRFYDNPDGHVWNFNALAARKHA